MNAEIEMQLTGLDNVARLTPHMVAMLRGMVEESYRLPYERLGMLCVALLPESKDSDQARFDLFASVVYLMLFWDTNTTTAPLHEPHFQLHGTKYRQQEAYWKRYIATTAPLFRSIRLAERTFYHTKSTEWLSYELDLLARTSQRSPAPFTTTSGPNNGKYDGISELAHQSELLQETPVTLVNTTTENYVTSRMSNKPLVLVNHLRKFADHAEESTKHYREGVTSDAELVTQRSNFLSHVEQDAAEALTVFAVASKSVSSSIGKGESFKQRFQDLVKRMYSKGTKISRSAGSYVVPVVLGDARFTTPDLAADHLIHVNEILSTFADVTGILEEVDPNQTAAEATRLEQCNLFFDHVVDAIGAGAVEHRRILHPSAYLLLCKETTHCEHTALPTGLNMESATLESPMWWDVFTGMPILDPRDGYYETRFLKHHSPITIVLSYAGCVGSQTEVLRREKRIYDTFSDNPTVRAIWSRMDSPWKMPGGAEARANRRPSHSTSASALSLVDPAVQGRSTFSAPYINLADWASFLHCVLHRLQFIQTPQDHLVKMDVDGEFNADVDFDGNDDDDGGNDTIDSGKTYQDVQHESLPTKAAVPPASAKKVLPPTLAPKQSTAPVASSTAKPKVAPAPPASKKQSASVKKAAAQQVAVDDDDDDEIEVVAVKKAAPAKPTAGAPPKAPAKGRGKATAAVAASAAAVDPNQALMAMMTSMMGVMSSMLAGGGNADAATNAMAQLAQTMAAVVPKGKKAGAAASAKKTGIVKHKNSVEVDYDAVESDDEPVVDDTRAEVDDLERVMLETAKNIGDDDSDNDRENSVIPPGYFGSQNDDFLYLSPLMECLSLPRDQRDKVLYAKLSTIPVKWVRMIPESKYLTCLNVSPAAALITYIVTGQDSRRRDNTSDALNPSAQATINAIYNKDHRLFEQPLMQRQRTDMRYKSYTALSTLLRQFFIDQHDVERWEKRCAEDVVFLQTNLQDLENVLVTPRLMVDLPGGYKGETEVVLSTLLDDIDWNEQTLNFLADVEALLDPSEPTIMNVATLQSTVGFAERLYKVFPDNILHVIARLFEVNLTPLEEGQDPDPPGPMEYTMSTYTDAYVKEALQLTGKRATRGNSSDLRIHEIMRKYGQGDASDDENFSAPDNGDDDDDDGSDLSAVEENSEKHSKKMPLKRKLQASRKAVVPVEDDVVIHDEDGDDEEEQAEEKEGEEEEEQEEQDDDSEEQRPAASGSRKRTREEKPAAQVDLVSADEASAEPEELETPAAKRVKPNVSEAEDADDMQVDQEGEAEAEVPAEVDQEQGEEAEEAEEAEDAQTDGDFIENDADPDESAKAPANPSDYLPPVRAASQRVQTTKDALDDALDQLEDAYADDESVEEEAEEAAEPAEPAEVAPVEERADEQEADEEEGEADEEENQQGEANEADQADGEAEEGVDAETAVAEPAAADSEVNEGEDADPMEGVEGTAEPDEADETAAPEQAEQVEEVEEAEQAEEPDQAETAEHAEEADEADAAEENEDDI